jgi:hypothetical protein
MAVDLDVGEIALDAFRFTVLEWDTCPAGMLCPGNVAQRR